MDKVFKAKTKKYNIPYDSKEKKAAYKTCKKTFCNKKCVGYDFYGDKKKQLAFQRKIKNGFQDTYSSDKVNRLKQKGALSGCVDIVDFDIKTIL